MKKLMLLGGSLFLLPVIEKAHEMGLYVITCDYLPDNPAHKYADKYLNISIIEKDKILEAAKEEKIDGILSFACDPGVVTAAYVAEMLNLPSPGPYESVCILQNKGLFRKFLKDHNFNVPMSKAYHDIKEAINDSDLFNWPVIVKPTDSAGSKGVTKVVYKEKLEDAIKIALEYSHSNEFIIEDFLEQKGYSSDCDSFSHDGKFTFYSFSSQIFDKNASNPYTPAAYIWPSSISVDNQKILKDELQRLISLLNMKTSIYNIEVRETKDGVPYIMEVSPRGGGNRLAEMMRYITGVDLIEAEIKMAIGMDTSYIKEKEIEGYWGEVILHSTKEGLYQEIKILDKIKKNVIEEQIWVNKDEQIGAFKGANEAIGTLVLKFDTEEELKEVFENVDKYIEIVVR